ncbi:AAA family ATPase [Spirosoma sp. KCTC 42546]|uniref:AAA family ATPase n=1 Tax=Spirosoma sp. KCTC 42546 TaxID=2520506 RepID=UPI00115A8813|nr:AAA family ATPase [Spirosoma sp. KCTC 42546]QDK78543.1 AAA family ATPase [Spirosoma sp. KCTC 42546]
MKDLNAFAQQLAARMEQQLARSPQSLINSIEDADPEADSITTGPLDTLAQLTQQAEERAAVSGRFAPVDLVAFIGDDSIRQQTLSRLAPTCTIETVDGKLQWLLAQNYRNDTLKKLVSSDRLTTVLNEPLPATDLFGDMLRKVLKEGDKLPLVDRSSADLQAISAATDAISDTGLPQPDPAQIRNLLLKDTLLADYEILLKNQFVGREEELKKLELFVLQGSGSVGYSEWSGLGLTGVGGVGKSTLLAKFAEDAVARKLATLVLLDFDRPGIDPRDQYWLEMEMTRQVGLQYADLAEPLRQLRADWRQQRQSESVANPYQQSSKNQYFTESVEVSRGFRSIVSEMRQLIQQANLEKPHTVAQERPFLLVLDTFEEVMQLELAGRVLDWLSDIGNALRPIPLRVIFSGRLFDDDQTELGSWGVRDFIELTELDHKQAELLLHNLGVAKPMAKRLSYSDLFPRRPLEIRLLAKIATRESASSIDELEAEIRQGGPAAKNLFTGIVYKRLLQRIDNKDKVIRELAYPGLVLRYVTPALIEQVLVPALDLTLMDDPAVVLTKLASYSWLASRRASEDPQEVWHRRDLRRSVLQLILAQEPGKARRISELAVKFFADKPEKEWAEGIYHQLILMRDHQDGETFELADLKQAGPWIKLDLTDLPKPAQVLFRFATEGRVQSGDVDCLPNRYLAGAYQKTGRRLVNSREFTKALQLLRRGQGANIAYKLPNPTRPDLWEIDVLFATASWADLPDALDKTVVVPTDASLVNFANWLYPAVLVNPELRSPAETARRLADATQSEKAMDDVLTGSDATLVVSYLSVGLVLQQIIAPLTADSRRRIGQFIGQTEQQAVIRKSARLSHKLVLLSLLSDQPATSFSLAPSIVRINSAWLKRLAKAKSTGDRAVAVSLVQLTENALVTGLKGKQRTVRRLLRTIDALYKEREQWQQVTYQFADFQNADECLALFRGPDSDFRDPCRFALLEAYSDPESRRQLGALFSSILNLDLIDLVPEAFAESLAPDPEHGLESYVELVDRTWQLGELLRRAVIQRPQTPKLKLVLDAYERWDKAFRETVGSIYTTKN